jgi:hypothetical protein
MLLAGWEAGDTVSWVILTDLPLGLGLLTFRDFCNELRLERGLVFVVEQAPSQSFDLLHQRV